MSGENIILLPKTVDYYQFQLTALLETERYGEAMELLRFLLNCRTSDDETIEEWKTLLAWLASEFPQEQLEEDVYEEDILKRHLQSRAATDERFVEHLLELVQYAPSVDEKLMAIEQLVHLDHPLINDTLIRWLENADVPATIQFSVLQALRKRGVVGEVEILNNGDPVYIRVEDTPDGIEAFPERLQQVLQHVRKVSEEQYPSLIYFAEQFWLEWLYGIYGTERYDYLMQEMYAPEVWAAALHFMVEDTMLGGAKRDEIFDLYGIADEQRKFFEKAAHAMEGWGKADS